VKYRGFSPRTRVLRWGLLFVLVLIVAGGTSSNALDGLARWLGADSASLTWYSSRLTGFVAYLALTASVIYGLLLSTGILDAVAHRAVSFTLHQELAAVALSLTAVHGALLGLDRTVPTSVVAIVVPFGGDYRPVWVGLGQLAFYLSVAVYASFSLRKRIGHRGWRLIHYATFLVFAGATAHGLMSGSDTSSPWATATYALPTVAIGVLTASRLAGSLWTRVTRRPMSARAIEPGGD